MAQQSVDQSLDEARRHHKAGRMKEAKAVCRRIIASKPNSVEALTLLGAATVATGEPEEAAQLFERATRIQPESPVAWRGVADARRLLAEQRRSVEQLGLATAAYRKVAELMPNQAEAQTNLGNCLRSGGQTEAAIECYRRAMNLDPNYAIVYYNYGNLMKDMGRAEEAIAAYRRATDLWPDLHLAQCNLGNLLKEKGRLQESVVAYRMCVQAKPDFDIGHSNLGTALKELNHTQQAIASYYTALALKPNSFVYHYNMGTALGDAGRLEEAAASYRRAIELKPDFHLAHSNLGTALKDLHKLDESIAAYQKALRLAPNFQPAHYNLGNAMKDAGDLDAAIACYRRALELTSTDATAHSNLAYVVHFHPAYDGPAILAENRRWDALHAAPVGRDPRPLTNVRDPNRRLRIGYVGSDFRDHCQSLFIIPLFANHDHQNFEIFAYANVPQDDFLTERTRGMVDQWRSTFNQGDAAVAEQVRADGIDILIDLTMHMARGRPLLFARKVAPVQIAWLAYPGTTGLSAIDYRFTDPYLDPPGETDSHYAEKSYRLPDTFWCYDPLVEEIPVNPLPAAASGSVTFGCLNNYCKITQPTIELWARVLRAVDRSRLAIMSPSGRHRQTLLDRFAALKIDPRRINFIDFKPRAEYLRGYHNIDLCLDTIPYNGHTTSLDSYWMGVPVVTLVGKTAVGRAGWSQLNNLGMTELAAQTPEQFVRIAADLASDLPRLADLRANLRQRLQQSPLMDGKKFARGMEAAFRDMWRQWCAGA